MGREAGIEALTSSVAASPLDEPLRLRWEKDSRYYEVHVVQDLWGEWVLTRIWGQRGTAMGQIRRVPCESYAEALTKLAQMEKRRAQRGYAAVGPRT